MDKTLENLLGSELLSEEVKGSLQEAFEKKLQEEKVAIREAVEKEVREDFTRQYDHDKSVLIESVDKMVTESVRKELEEFAQDRKALTEERAKLSEAIRQARKDYKTRVVEHTKVLENFVLSKVKEELTEFNGDRVAVAKQRVKLSNAIMEAKGHYAAKMKTQMKVLESFMLAQLKNELVEFTNDRKSLQTEKVKVAKALREHRVGLNEQFAGRLKKLESFVLKQLTKEINEFDQDKKALVETRVKMVTEGKTKIDETRKAFIKRASTLVEKTLDETLRKEMEQFRDDIKVARQNHFGRKLFEAFYAEFMTSYLSEGTQTKQIAKKLDEVKAQLEESNKNVSQHEQLLEAANRKIKLAEEKAQRVEVIGQLLAPLTRDKRAVMEELLENVRTTNLKEAFQKYLPAVLNENASRSEKKTLVESSEKISTKTTVTVTGDRKNRLSESAKADDMQHQVTDIIELRRLAGYKD